MKQGKTGVDFDLSIGDQHNVSIALLGKGTVRLVFGMYQSPSQAYLQRIVQNVWEYKQGRNRFQLYLTAAREIISQNPQGNAAAIKTQARALFR